jgi:hypothetical protein
MMFVMRKFPKLGRGNLFGRHNGDMTPRKTHHGAHAVDYMALQFWNYEPSDISHFGCGKNVGLCTKKLLARVYGGILWMDRPVHIDVALIAKITGFPTVGMQPEEYLDNKAREKEITEIVKA